MKNVLLTAALAYKYRWYCAPQTETVYAPPPFETGCIQDTWPGSYCCTQGDQ